MRIPFEGGCLRSWRAEDADAIWPLADNRKIWRNLRDGFPHPYGRADAVGFIEQALARVPETFLCIEVGGRVAGSIGLIPLTDVERFSAELGYWLAEAHWGQGLTARAVGAICTWGFEDLGLERIFATPYAWNPASCRVLEKAGFQLEGRLRAGAFKDGQWVDKLLYARLSGD